VVIDGQYHLRPGSRVAIVPELVGEEPETPNTE
jgi:hypothetical protein